MLKLGVIGTNIITDQVLDATKTTGKYELTAVYSRTLEHAEKNRTSQCASLLPQGHHLLLPQH